MRDGGVPSGTAAPNKIRPPNKKQLYQQERLEIVTAKADWSRQMDDFSSDPRCKGWPCFGRHTSPPNFDGNAHGAWKHCVKCDVRLIYVPYHGAPATHATTANASYVELAQNALMHDMPLEYVDRRIFSQKIKEIATQYKKKQERNKIGIAPRGRSPARTQTAVASATTGATGSQKQPLKNGDRATKGNARQSENPDSSPEKYQTADSSPEKTEVFQEPAAKRSVSARSVRFPKTDGGTMAVEPRGSTKRGPTAETPQPWPTPTPFPLAIEDGPKAMECSPSLLSASGSPAFGLNWQRFGAASFLVLKRKEAVGKIWFKMATRMIRKKGPTSLKRWIKYLAASKVK